MYSLILSFDNPTFNLVKSSDHDGCYILQIKDENNMFGWHFDSIDDFMQKMGALASMREEVKHILEEAKGK